MPGLDDSRRWSVLPGDPAAEARLQRELGLGPLTARVMAARGIVDVDEARAFLTPSLDRDWEDPLSIPGMLEAADRVERAISRGEKIAVFGDFDVDGMTATSLLTLALRRMGADAEPFIPDRFTEGYGLSRASLDRVIGACHPSLVVTVDNGIAAGAEVAWLTAEGIDVVITDHHEPADLVPQGVPVTDPKLSDDCPSRNLAGVGVALKLVQVLGERLGQPDLWRRYTEVAALGTLSDMMTLQGENRALVADGVARMRTTDRPGLVALAATANQDLAQVTADGLPFSLIPRLNAAGRMGCTDVAFRLLLTDDPAEAAILAAQLEQANTDRRDVEGPLSDAAMELAERDYDGRRAVIVAHEGWHEGVKGLAATRLSNRYHVPAIVFTIQDGVARGSGRSVGSVDLFRAVEQCADILVRFGGHPGAVGVTCAVENLDAFRDRLCEVLAELPADQFESTGEVAAVVSLGELTVSSIDELECLQPFGQGNKKPLLAVRGVTMRKRQRVGADYSHLRFLATDGISSTPAIQFRTPQIERASECEGAVDLVFEPTNETWQGRTKPKLMVKDILYRDAAPEPDPADDGEKGIAQSLFDRADQILAADEYASIADEDSFHTKAVGVTYGDRQAVVASLAAGDRLAIERESDNPADPNAIRILTAAGAQVGYLRREIARVIAPAIDAGAAYHAVVADVTGGGEGRSHGVNIEVSRESANAPEAESQDLASLRAPLAALGEKRLTAELTRKMIGEHDLLPAQAMALETLAAGRNCLCVMATGRGKSLIFHIHAARTALLHDQASVFVYPLRALVADQSFHLSEVFAELGMVARVLTGETPLEERTAAFEGLAAGSVDVVLTTPEFLAIHQDRFAKTGRVGFVVVDEAHHAGLSKSGNRSAYASLPEVREALGEPTVLAVTATAADPVAREVCRLAGIDEADVVQDRSVRENLSVVDCRELQDRDAALVATVATGQKTVVYVNSRDQSVSLARMLRHAIPELGRRIAFYNAGLTRSDRTRVEEAFRKGELTCIVSTSAFGEGVNLPDIRNVMLYHMPFGQIEFNQMSGRAGRDGAPARVHLLFGTRDTRINERIVAAGAPARNDLATLYRALTVLQSAATAEGEDSFRASNADIAGTALAIDPRARLDERTVSCGIAIFRELGFLATSGFSTARRITMATNPERMELTRSTRFLEGQRAREEFCDFSEWALSAPADEMLDRINRPITPSFGRVIQEGGTDGRR